MTSYSAPPFDVQQATGLKCKGCLSGQLVLIPETIRWHNETVARDETDSMTRGTYTTLGLLLLWSNSISSQL